MKELIIFDLDGTLNVSKMPLDKEMATLLCKLIAETKVAVISGASFTQFERQFLESLNCPSGNLSNLFLMPTSGGSLYEYKENNWTHVYKDTLSLKETEKILEAFDSALADAGIAPESDIHGELIEDRGSQVAYSALGQNAPIELKEKWDPDHSKREIIIEALMKYIPEFEVRIGGTTTIDVTKSGINKAYGVKKITEYLSVQKEDVLFIGDSVFPGGNDYSVKEAGIETIGVSGPEKTKEIINGLLDNA
ncbi:MAG TPA: HAD-IIB family hydrolase [Candidatus Yonathbacteria bacterium]|nr:HAD-IIB family hydrolase [Candidatus Yonathbacteria bacterium]